MDNCSDMNIGAVQMGYHLWMKNKSCQEIVVANLAALMKHHDLKPDRLHKISGVSSRMISFILTYDRNPSIEIVERLAKAFKIPTWMMFLPELATLSFNTKQLDRLVSVYTRADTDSREYVYQVAEREARYLPASDDTIDDIEAAIDQVASEEGFVLDQSKKEQIMDAIRSANTSRRPKKKKKSA